MFYLIMENEGAYYQKYKSNETEEFKKFSDFSKRFDYITSKDWFDNVKIGIYNNDGTPVKNSQARYTKLVTAYSNRNKRRIENNFVMRAILM